MANIYDMMREKARSMGHAAATLPDSAWQKYLEQSDQKTVLRKAKLYIENYMTGNVSVQDFALAMAEDDRLRYTVSDLCRSRLEPVIPDIQRNDSYIDVGAGIKTFWTEIRVPLPSELDTARNVMNIHYGIEAARAVHGQTTTKESVKEEPTRRRSLRETLNEVRKKAAEKAIEKLTPIADGQKTERDETWLKTNEGQAYQKAYTREAAQQIENTVMSIEAGKTANLDENERKKALEASGIGSEQADQMIAETIEENTTGLRSGYQKEDLDRPMNDDMKELFDQILTHVSNERTAGTKPEAIKNGNQQNKPENQMIEGVFEGKQVSFKGKWSNHVFTPDEAEKLLAGETIAVTYTDKKGNEKTVDGKLEWQSYQGREYLGFKADFSHKNQDKPVSQMKGDDSLFNASDEELMNYHMGSSEYTEVSVEVTVESSADVADYYAHLAEDMASYQSSAEYPVCPEEDGEVVELSAEDCAALFQDEMQL